MQPAESLWLGRRHALLLHAVACVVFVSGAAAGLTDIAGVLGCDWEAPDGLMPWAMRVHGGAVMVLLVVIGTVLPLHVRRAWATGRNRRSGIVFLTSLGLLALTGYGLLYVGGEPCRTVLHGIHLGLGLLDPVLVVVHVVCGRRSRRRERLNGQDHGIRA